MFPTSNFFQPSKMVWSVAQEMFLFFKSTILPGVSESNFPVAKFQLLVAKSKF